MSPHSLVVPGLTPRFAPLQDNAYCNGSQVAIILGTTGAFLGAALFSVILRMYVRINMLKLFGPDDYMILAATLMAIGTFIGFVGESFHGIGHHTSCIPVHQLEEYWKFQFYHSIWVMFGVVFVKISIAFFLMRLAPKSAWRKLLWVAIIFLICFSLTCAGTLIFSCVPVSATWDLALKAKPTTKCFSMETYVQIGVFNSVINILTDFLFAFLPIPIIMKLHINLRTKIALAAILGLGLVACAAGIVKANLQANYAKNPDVMWTDSFNLWNMLELCLGIIAATLPSLKPLFTRMLETTRTKLGMSSAASRNRSGKGNHLPGDSKPFSSQHSGGYRRTYDPRNIHDILADVDLHNYKKSPISSTVETRVDADSIPEVPPLAHRERGRNYDVRITSGEHDRSDRGWDDGHDFSRHDSEERLHHPIGIYKTLEISRTSECSEQ